MGRFRRNRLSPMPVVDSLDEIKEKIRGWDTADNDRRINNADTHLLAPRRGLI